MPPALNSSRAWGAGALVALVVALCVGFTVYQIHQKHLLELRAGLLTGGAPAAGPAAMAKYGCGGCHAIPGVVGARGMTGPPLSGVGQRAYVAGVLRNRPENLVRWIRTPREINPQTAMPDMGVTETDARNIAAYLYTLQ